jgi:hypothetical protein
MTLVKPDMRGFALLAGVAVLSGAIVGLSPAAATNAATNAPSVKIAANEMSATSAEAVSALAALPSSTSGFDPGYIISDGVFFNSDTMTQTQIQSWIESKSSTCTDYTSGGTQYTCLKNYKTTSTTRLENRNCSAIPGQADELASSIIYRVSKACGINPQVILVTLQKEQSLITGGARSSGVYRKAMGYGCPDTAACNSQYYGMFDQVYGAAWQFRNYGTASAGSYRHNAGSTVAVYYHPNSSCGTKSVTIRNKATAALYNYTPYTPNTAALSAGTGLGDTCSSYGNRNFYVYFKSWFGSPSNLLKNSSFESSPGVTSWSTGSTSGVTFTAVKNSAIAHGGSKYTSVSVNKAGGLIKQDLSFKTKVNGVYTGGVWLRASRTDNTVSGTLQVWAVGGSTEKSSAPFTVTDEWTFVQTDLTVAKSGHTGVRFIVWPESLNTPVLVDDTEFSMSGTVIPPQKPMTSNGLLNPGFENQTGTDFWVNGNGGMNYSAYASSTYAKSGKKYLRAMATSSGDRIKQTVMHDTEPGETYVATMWVRASTSEPVLGSLTLMTGGATEESASIAFTLVDVWQKVSVELPITRTGNTDLRFVLEIDTTGLWIRADDASLALAATAPAEPSPDVDSLTVVNAGFESGTSPWAPGAEGAIKFSSYTSASYAHSGTGYLRVEAEKPGRRVKQTIKAATAVGETYTNGIWLRAAHTGETVSGSLSLWAAGGGSLESTATKFTVGNDWTFVTNDLLIKDPGHTELRFVVQVDTVGAYLRLDDVELMKK